ncbi:hypothetical protein ACJX0J_009989, partial [Zea mays]
MDIDGDLSSLDGYMVGLYLGWGYPIIGTCHIYWLGIYNGHVSTIPCTSLWTRGIWYIDIEARDTYIGEEIITISTVLHDIFTILNIIDFHSIIIFLKGFTSILNLATRSLDSNLFALSENITCLLHIADDKYSAVDEYACLYLFMGCLYQLLRAHTIELITRLENENEVVIHIYGTAIAPFHRFVVWLMMLRKLAGNYFCLV